MLGGTPVSPPVSCLSNPAQAFYSPLTLQPRERTRPRPRSTRLCPTPGRQGRTEKTQTGSVDSLIYDGGIVTATQADFSGRITVPDVASVSDHATHVAGTAVGSGSLSASADGSANQWRGDVFDQYKQRFLSREPVAQSCLHAPRPVL